MIGSDQVMMGKLSLRSWQKQKEFARFEKCVLLYENMRREALIAVVGDENLVRVVLRYLRDLETNEDAVRSDRDIVAAVYNITMSLVRDFEKENNLMERLL